MLSQGKDDNEAGREKDKQETANINDCEYNVTVANNTIVREMCQSLVNSYFVNGFLATVSQGFLNPDPGRSGYVG